jgi:hypothetical protein
MRAGRQGADLENSDLRGQRTTLCVDVERHGEPAEGQRDEQRLRGATHPAAPHYSMI